jgi:hypothetical protein
MPLNQLVCQLQDFIARRGASFAANPEARIFSSLSCAVAFPLHV